jgi:hypothetical protein
MVRFPENGKGWAPVASNPALSAQQDYVILVPQKCKTWCITFSTKIGPNWSILANTGSGCKKPRIAQEKRTQGHLGAN